MTADGPLNKAQTVLSCLQYFTCYLADESSTPPDGFFFGLSVILSNIEDDVLEAQNIILREKSEGKTT